MKRILLITISVLFAFTFSHSQGNSPYSRYGFGTMADRSMGFNKGMGGVAQAMRNGQQINTANPASYAAVDSLTALFDLGFSAYNGNYKMGNRQQNARNTSFDYFAFQFRAFKGLGITAAILPYTNIGYNMESPEEQVAATESTTAAYTFTGNGGTHKVLLGIGWQPFKPLSIGANISYLYGDINHTSSMSFNQSGAYNLMRKYTSDIATYGLDFGAQYTLALGKKDFITLGATYQLGHDVKNKAYRTTSTQLVDASALSTISTHTDTLRNAYQLPQGFGAGIAYNHDAKWRVGADFLVEQWSKCKFPVQNDDATGEYTSKTGTFADYTRFSIGAEFTPNPNGRTSLSSITYRIGGHYAKTYATTDYSGILSDNPYEYGLTAGISIPFKNRNIWYNSPRLNISAQWVHTDIPYINSYTKQQSKLTENYLRLCVGLTFSERWFNKWKLQ